MDYHNKKFRAVDNSANGEVESETTFHYRQKGDVFWATYEGQKIVMGTITGKVGEKGKLEFTYQHINTEGEFRTGYCKSRPEVLPNGRIRLREKWKWTCGDFSEGTSIVEEIEP